MDHKRVYTERKPLSCEVYTCRKEWGSLKPKPSSAQTRGVGGVPAQVLPLRRAMQVLLALALYLLVFVLAFVVSPFLSMVTAYEQKDSVLRKSLYYLTKGVMFILITGAFLTGTTLLTI